MRSLARALLCAVVVMALPALALAGRAPPRWPHPAMVLTGRALAATGGSSAAAGAALLLVAELRPTAHECGTERMVEGNMGPPGERVFVAPCPSTDPAAVGTVVLSVGVVTAFTGVALWLTGEQDWRRRPSPPPADVVVTDRGLALRLWF